MITGLYPNSQWIETGVSAPTPYISSSANPMQGVVRCINNRYEVWDGNNWLVTGGGAPIDLSTQGKMAIEWAYNKMHEERFIKDLAKTNIAVSEALSAVERAEEQLKVVVALVQENK